MYQINEQIIMPMTRDTSLICPGVSWALTRSLAGTPVTHFVSHAWDEGVFEFDRYLRMAWEGDGAAYICFLSNPQNLPVGEMVASIETSPFYIALKRLPGKMFVVATENGVVPERQWCVVELYLAIKEQA